MTRPNFEQNIERLTQSELFQKVGDICATMNTLMTDKELLEESLKEIMELFGAKRGSIFILKDCGEGLILKAARGMTFGEQEKFEKRLGEGVVGRVAASKKPIVVKDISSDDRFENYKPRTSYSTPSFICSPLLIKDRLIGVINITDKETGGSFREHELQLLDFLSSQIALNHHRVKLYEKFNHILEKSENLKNELGKSNMEAKHLKKQIVLQEKLATIGKLAGGIAHEFNNPLDGALRYTNLCLELVKEEEAVHGYLLEIKQGLNRMANIVRNLLACSRSRQPVAERVNVNNVIEQCLQSLQVEISQKKIKLNKDLAEGLPQIIDLGLGRIVINLIRNSIDAIEQEGSLTVKTFMKDGSFMLEIRDTGKGILEEEVEKIFEPFYTTKDIDKGCGLGLTIVSEIIKSYNGRIDVETEIQKGTAFTIAIPVSSNQ